jgi:hypothetical protein
MGMRVVIQMLNDAENLANKVYFWQMGTSKGRAIVADNCYNYSHAD